ncbi:MAG: hypothetical protein U0164_22510 [Gemmatimonadaceae bacterium]
MRRHSRALLVTVLASACSSGTDPDATVLHIRLLDDRGEPAGRHQVVVTAQASAPFTRVTSLGGTLDLSLRDGGSYRVQVIPRAGYVSLPTLSREVTLPAHQRTVIGFTLQREGVSTNDIPPR